MANKFVWGPGQQHSETAAPEGVVAVAISTIKPGGLVEFSVGVAEAGVHQPLAGLHVLYMAAQPAPTDDPSAALTAATIKGSADPAVAAAGGTVTVQVAPVPPARTHWVQSILELAS